MNLCFTLQKASFEFYNCVFYHTQLNLLNELKFELRGPPWDHVSEIILKKDQLEAEIWPFKQTYLPSIPKGNFSQ